MLTNSMEALDDKKRLGSNDFVSFRVVEDRDNESQRLRVNDNGELEVPYIGPVPGYDNLFVAAGHFRAGIQLSPGTALLIKESILGQPLSMSLAAFRVERDARERN